MTAGLLPSRRGAHPANLTQSATATPHSCAPLLEAVHSVPLDGVREHLAPAKSFSGGQQWESTLRETVMPRLLADIRGEARRRIDALADLPTSDVVVNHGDLADSNVLWADGKVSEVLDWDLASAEDPAEDVASPLS